MILAIVVFIGVYGYQLFSWSDLHPITVNDVVYMFEFTISHIMFSAGMIFKDILANPIDDFIFTIAQVMESVVNATGLSRWIQIKLWDDGSMLIQVLDRVVSGCITYGCWKM